MYINLDRGCPGQGFKCALVTFMILGSYQPSSSDHFIDSHTISSLNLIELGSNFKASAWTLPFSSRLSPASSAGNGLSFSFSLFPPGLLSGCLGVCAQPSAL